MKQKLLHTFFATLSVVCLAAQVANTFNYQAVARNAAGSPIAGQLIALNFTIHADSANGAVVYQENQTGVPTNQFGLFAVKIGGTDPAVFSAVNWKAGDKFLQVKFDANNGTGFTDMGTTQLLSVPYALVSKTATDMSLGELNNVSNVAPNAGEVLSWSGTEWAAADAKNTAYQKVFNGFVTNQRNTLVPDTGLYFTPTKTGTYLVSYYCGGNYDQSFYNTDPAIDGAITTYIYDLTTPSNIFSERSAVSSLENIAGSSGIYRVKDQPFSSSFIATLQAGHLYGVKHYMNTTGLPLPTSNWYMNNERLIAVKLY